MKAVSSDEYHELVTKREMFGLSTQEEIQYQLHPITEYYCQAKWYARMVQNCGWPQATVDGLLEKERERLDRDFPGWEADLLDGVEV